jgi:hypothetical protein
MPNDLVITSPECQIVFASVLLHAHAICDWEGLCVEDHLTILVQDHWPRMPNKHTSWRKENILVVFTTFLIPVPPQDMCANQIGCLILQFWVKTKAAFVELVCFCRVEWRWICYN